MNFRVISLALSVAVLSGCVAIKTDSWQAPSADLSSLSTYSWAPEGLQTGGDVRIDRAFLAPRITAAVELLLDEKGYTKAESKASFLLKSAVQLAEKQEQTAPSNGDEESPRSGFVRKGKLDWELKADEEVNVSYYEEGALLLMVVDPVSDQILWQGSGRLRVDRDQASTHKEELLRNVVRRTMRPFPECRQQDGN